jgi:hypothetical protein
LIFCVSSCSYDSSPCTWEQDPECAPSLLSLQASDRLYYLYQTLADTAEALGATPEGQAALQQAQQAQQQQADGGSSSSSASSGKGGGKGSSEPPPGQQLLLGEVLAALSDDLNTPLAVAALSGPLKLMNDLLHTKKVCLGALPRSLVADRGAV